MKGYAYNIFVECVVLLCRIVLMFYHSPYKLKSFPTGDLKPQPFKEGARAKIEKTADAVRRKHGMDFPGAVVQWNEFLRIAPQTDDVYDYVKDHPLYVPFKEEVFGISSYDGRYAASIGGHDSQTKSIRQQDEDAARKMHKKVEVWRTMPCMDKGAQCAFERVKHAEDENGNAILVPFYDNSSDDEDFSSEDEELSSSEDEEGKIKWCTVRRNGNIAKFGDSFAYVGLRFERKTDPKTDRLQSGFIKSVARRKDTLNGALHFRLCSHDKDTEEDEYVYNLYVPCKTIMSTGRKNIYKVRLYVV